MKQESTETANKQSGERYARKRKISERAKSGEMPSGSAGISARPRFSVLRPSRAMQACACLAERSDATCHRQAHATVPRLINYTFSIVKFTHFCYIISNERVKTFSFITFKWG